MRKILNTVNSKLTALAVRTKSVIAKHRGEGYVDSGVFS